MHGLLEIPANTRAWAEIDLSALQHNFRIAQAAGKRVMCVVKADAYGHGALACARALQEQGADCFAVACLQEAVVLREGGITKPILILGYTSETYMELLIAYELTQTVVDMAHAEALNKAAIAANKRVVVHVKVDTGMSRAGIPAQGKMQAGQAAKIVAHITGMQGLLVEGLYTHCAVADALNEDTYTMWQYRNFMEVLHCLEAWNCRPALCHMGNSACILGHPALHLDMVRAGIMLYGISPDGRPHLPDQLRPVMALKSRVSQINIYPEGASVGYGRTYCTGGASKLAVLSVGYADGFPRRLSNRAYVTVQAQQYPQVGCVCMDMLMVDITKAGQAIRRGDEAVLLGAGGMSLEEAARVVGTIPYELACLVTARAQRVYLTRRESASSYV